MTRRHYIPVLSHILLECIAFHFMLQPDRCPCYTDRTAMEREKANQPQ